MTETVSLEAVQAQADALGINYHHRAGAEKIAGLVAQHLTANPADALKLVPQGEISEPEAQDTPKEWTGPSRAAGDPCPVEVKTRKEIAKTNLSKRLKLVGSLVRVRLQNMNPAKREWNGEFISVGSAKHGTYKKFIPFNGEPYHVPKIILDHLKERTCTVFRTEKNANGVDRKVSHQIKEYAIEILPPLTAAELDELRNRQAMAKAGL